MPPPEDSPTITALPRCLEGIVKQEDDEQHTSSPPPSTIRINLQKGLSSYVTQVGKSGLPPGLRSRE
ncbi:hypothetical protein CERZMDRAFT_100030 [Cercospora zeae-maydis SCOH1-5]|uniref:Uncharacterized protein n=1 Tax=Cercospora zeae-maydis SCOH1-5 TaxID=717836 RepID=A0A6A6F9B8_9PEZI|nr:hypothetical protein CERZMDRAFT_100030 [Cercospora zeae-maydis SCOH1-5]